VIRQLYALNGADGVTGTVRVVLPQQDRPFRLRTVTCTFDSSGGLSTWYAIRLTALEGKVATTMRVSTPTFGPSLTGGVTWALGLDTNAPTNLLDFTLPLPEQVFEPNTEISLQMYADSLISTADLIGVPVFVVERM